MKIRQSKIVAVITLLLLFVMQVRAVDGVVEINQTCAIQTGCFGGDTSGFPIHIQSISTAKSFKLTSDLILPNENTTGISILTSNVNIDFNGFMIARAGCENGSCNILVGSGVAITAGNTIDNIQIYNGTVSGMGDNGIRIVGEFNIIRNMRVFYSGDDGIDFGSNGIVERNIVSKNNDQGIVLDNSNTIINNVVSHNVDIGIFASSSNFIIQNTVTNNDRGIFANSNSHIIANTISNNMQEGLVLGSTTSAYSRNVITNNLTGTVSGGTNLGNNLCNTNTVCP